MSSWTHRRQIRVPVDIKVTELGGGGAAFGQARDISTSGLYVDLGNFELQESELSVEFRLPGEEEPVWALCQVVRDDRLGLQDGHALVFQRLAEQDRQRIANYVQRYFQPVLRRRFQQVAQPPRKAGEPARTRFLFRAASEMLC